MFNGADSLLFRVLTAGSMKVRRDARLELAGTNLLINSVEQEDGGEYDCEVGGSHIFHLRDELIELISDRFERPNEKYLPLTATKMF